MTAAQSIVGGPDLSQQDVEVDDVADELELKIREALKVSGSTNGSAKPVGVAAPDDDE